MRTVLTTPCAAPDCAHTAESRRSPYCRTHRYRVDRYGTTQNPITPTVCDVCGTTFTPARADSIVCASPECRTEHYRRTKRRYKRDGPNRQRTPKPEPRSYAVFTRAEIGERDEWVCGVCSEPVDPARFAPDTRAPALAHRILPQDGGLHIPENCFIAHLECRAARGEPIN